MDYEENVYMVHRKLTGDGKVIPLDRVNELVNSATGEVQAEFGDLIILFGDRIANRKGIEYVFLDFF